MNQNAGTHQPLYAVDRVWSVAHEILREMGYPGFSVSFISGPTIASTSIDFATRSPTSVGGIRFWLPAWPAREPICAGNFSPERSVT